MLLALTAAGLKRDEAYTIVQAHALAAQDEGGSFRARLEADRRVTAALDAATLAACFDLEASLRNVDAIYARAGAPAVPELERARA